MKQTGDEHGGIEAPKPGGLGKGARPPRAPQIIVRLDPDFDIDSVFQAEPELIKPETKDPPVESLVRVAPEPVLVEPEPIVEPQLILVESEPIVEPPLILVQPEPIVIEPEPVVVEQPRAAATAVVLPAPAPVPDPVPVAVPIRMATAPSVESSGRSKPTQPLTERAKAPSLSIADLLENHVHLEWHEAVAIALHLCRVMARDPAANVHRSLVEPWNVEITNDGDVQVLPGGSSSDPLVKQVGRVLRTLLQDSIAPAELRLVASQASFDVPVYSGVDELAAALRHFERPGDSGAIRAAFNRGLEAKLSGFQAPVRAPVVVRPAAVDPVEITKRAAAPPPVLLRARWKHLQVRALATTGLLAVIMAAMVFVVSRRLRTVVEAPFPETRIASVVEPLNQTPQPRPADPVPASRAIEPERSPAPVVVPAPVPARAGHIAATVAAPAVPRLGSNPVSVPPGVRRQTPEPRSAAPAAALGDSIAAHEQQATGLLASGRADEAAMFFDAIVLKDPFYHPDPARMSVEALSAFRSSKRTILPAMARRHYLDGRAAFDAGDFTLAITEGERAQALLNDLNDVDAGGGAGDLSADVTNLLTLSSANRTLEEEKIYTAADASVTPPRPLGRQLSLASMSRMSLMMPTGRLEILVGRSGRVETVKLETPVNGYHDRMLVSAVKAWHYRPAVKNGRPVRFSLVMTIRLPDL